MPPLKIILQGHSAVTQQPERGVLHFNIRSDGPHREAVSKEVIETASEITRVFRELSPKSETGATLANAPITSFSSTALQTWASKERMPNSDEWQRIHSARLSIGANFQDFNKLNEVVSNLVIYPNVMIESLDWVLTEATQKSLSSEARKDAMRDAIQKANDYAEVIGRQVVAIKITDHGDGASGAAPVASRHRAMMMQQQMQPQMQPQQPQMPGPAGNMSSTSNTASLSSNSASNQQSRSGSPSGLDLSPQLIKYSSSVSVEFADPSEYFKD
ncbi:hypothetical protein N7532_002103 [Penicillium argentinense]|uniref:Uncharacterized protein n=1 Tax=Penicillium argentinense TaxID=1131581 RepID=A0A9W9KN28_9EURO|nr:uncharacterized protein N7532_002103 [Penicillium argentinense]KAJ5111568.1 hypothetical protein N7532_002103 [Penicillium argentinense]